MDILIAIAAFLVAIGLSAATIFGFVWLVKKIMGFK
jgi:hypothetical protein